ncbi:MAG: hypothetical protein H6569_04010 [Lewinellaceae bacterium]|nr:hypothetical protein [Lewinellaceae bacterium]
MSREICVQYMTPLGLHHLFDTATMALGSLVTIFRSEWNPTYYHQ